MSIIRNLIYSIPPSVRTRRAEQPHRRWEILNPRKNEHAEEGKREPWEMWKRRRLHSSAEFREMEMFSWRCVVATAKPVSKVESRVCVAYNWEMAEFLLFSTKCKMLCVFAGETLNQIIIAWQTLNLKSEEHSFLPEYAYISHEACESHFFPPLFFFSPFFLSIKIWAKIREKKLPWFHCGMQVVFTSIVRAPLCRLNSFQFWFEMSIVKVVPFLPHNPIFHTNIYSESVVIIIRLRQATSCDQLLCCAWKNIHISFSIL